MSRLSNWLFGERSSSPLKRELGCLIKNIQRDDRKLASAAQAFWDNDGICCPWCGVPGYSRLLLKQERREKRVQEIRKKLERDSNPILMHESAEDSK